MIVLLKLLPDNKHAIHSNLRSVTQNQHKLKIQLATPFLNWQNKVGLLLFSSANTNIILFYRQVGIYKVTAYTMMLKF